MKFTQRIRTTLAGVTAGLVLTTGLSHAVDYTAWTGKRNITLNTTATGANVKGEVRNFPVLIRLNAAAAESTIVKGAKALGADIRFSKSDSSTALPYHIESWDSTGAAIWVKVDTIKANNSSQFIRIYWGNPAANSESNSATVFDTANGYRSVFHMNDTGNTLDATANAVVGTNVGTVRTAAGLAGPARTFAGTNATSTNDTIGRQYINLNNPPALNFLGRITMSAWVRWTNLVGTSGSSYYRTFINRDGTAPTSEVFLRIGHNAGNAEHAQYTTGKYTGSADVMAQSPIFASEYPDSAVWTHLAGVYDSVGPTQRIWRLYRNGVQIAVSEDAEAAGLTTPSTLWRLGRGPGTQNARWFVGDMDEVRISSVSRDSNYIKLSYENQKKTNSLVNIGGFVVATVPNAPAAPTTVLSTTTTGSVIVSWTAPTVDGGSAITSYKAYATDTTKSCTTSGLSCTITGLAVGTPTTFTVRAINAVGYSTFSAASSPALTPVTSIRLGDFAGRTNGLNPYTYRLSAAAAATTERLTMTIVDVHGKRVWSKSVNPSKGEGAEVTWNGRNAQGTMVSAGMYIVRVNIQSAGQTIKLDDKSLNLR